MNLNKTLLIEYLEHKMMEVPDVAREELVNVWGAILNGRFDIA